MQFSNTTTKDGMIQAFEFWTGTGDGVISGNSTQLKIATSRINRGFDSVMPLMLSYSDTLRWDDVNHGDLPIAKNDIVSGQNKYTITEDDNSLDVLNIVSVLVLQSATATDYVELSRVSLDNADSALYLSPNPNQTGVPQSFIEQNGTIFLDVKPTYNATNGMKLVFEREQSPFVSTDTTKEPGIPKPFHELLVKYAALDWLLVYKAQEGTLITRLEASIAKDEKALKGLIDRRNPTRRRLIPAYTSAE